MGNSNKRRRNQRERDPDMPAYANVRIKDPQEIMLAKRTGLQPFPKVPAFTVALTIL